MNLLRRWWLAWMHDVCLKHMEAKRGIEHAWCESCAREKFNKCIEKRKAALKELGVSDAK